MSVTSEGRDAANDSGQQMAINAVASNGTENDSNGVLVGVRSGNALNSSADT